jgi:hypothetical protein
MSNQVNVHALVREPVRELARIERAELELDFSAQNIS